jgi:integrase
VEPIASYAFELQGLPRIRFHDLRHSYASVLIAQGAHPKVISDQLGHASVQITIDRYSHLFDGAYSDVNDELERAWEATKGRRKLAWASVPE